MTLLERLRDAVKYELSEESEGKLFGEAADRIIKLEEALRLIAAPKRPDGTYNRCREACELLARDALKIGAPFNLYTTSPDAAAQIAALELSLGEWIAAHAAQAAQIAHYKQKCNILTDELDRCTVAIINAGKRETAWKGQIAKLEAQRDALTAALEKLSLYVAAHGDDWVQLEARAALENLK